jgi:hypothetical protein
MAILNQWGIPYGTALLQAKRQPYLMPVIQLFVEEDGNHQDITIYYHMVLQEDYDDYSDD